MKKILAITALFFLAFNSDAQPTAVKKDMLRTAANISSGNYRDIMTNFFQLALNDLTGPDKRFRFSSNLFAIKLKSNPDLNIDYNFIQNTFWRNSNVDFDLKLDSNYKFNGVSAGYKYAIVNRRDYAIAKDFRDIYEKAIKGMVEIQISVSQAYALVAGTDSAKLDKFNTDFNKFLTDNTVKFSSLSTELQNIINSTISKNSDSDWSFAQKVQDIYGKVVDTYKQKLLWTVAGSTSTYSDGFVFSNLDFTSQATAALIPTGKHSHIEFDIKAKYSFLDDTLKAGRDLKRQKLSSEGGFNWVFKNKDNSKPVVEFKVTTTYNLIPTGLYLNEKKSDFTFNGTLRLRITDNIWIPLEIKYDRKAKNLFGFLSFKSNFDWLGKK